MKMLEIAPKYSSLQHCNMYIFAIVPWGQGPDCFSLVTRVVYLTACCITPNFNHTLHQNRKQMGSVIIGKQIKIVYNFSYM